MHTPPPIVYHDLVDVAAKVGRVEERIGYNFKNKMLGDRILTLALCDTWFQTGNPAGMFDVQLTYLS